MNNVFLVGRVGQDPEMKFFDSGSQKARFTMAVNRSKEITDWFDVEAWGTMADWVGQWVRKGSPYIVQGRLEIQYWTDQSGQRREQAVIVANRINFCPSAKQASA